MAGATFNSPTDVSAGALARSAHINNLDAAVVEAFALLPTNAELDALTSTNIQFSDAVANYAALSTQTIDGYNRLDAATGNKYTWDHGNTKWRVMPGNRYTTAFIASDITAANFTIETGTIIFDTTLLVVKHWNGTAWINTVEQQLKDRFLI